MRSALSRAATAACARTRVRDLTRAETLGPCGLGLLAGLVLSAVPSLAPLGASAQIEGLSLQKALSKATERNRRLAAFAYRHAEDEGRLQQASQLPNPEIDLEIENFAGEGFANGFDGAETTLSLAWAIEPGLRGQRVGVAKERSAHTRLDEQILHLDVAAETAQRFLTCLESQVHLVAADQSVELSKATAAAAERRVRAGGAPNAELMRARAELASQRLARDDVTHERSVAYHRLAAQWGETTPSFSRVDGDLLELPAVPSFDALAARIGGNPKLARLASKQRIAEATLRLAQARRWPTVTPSLGVRRLELTGDWAMVAGISIPFPVFDRNQGRIAESRATLARTRADAEAERVHVHTALFELSEEMQHAMHRAEVLNNDVIPRFEQTMDETRRGYEAGRYSYSELRSTHAELITARRSLVEASTAAHRLVITLERLTGERVVR